MRSKRGLAAAIIVLIVAAACVRLGFWQLGRLEQRQAFNRAASAALAMPPLRLDSATLAAIFRTPERFLYRRAVAEGRLLEEGEALLRGRARAGSPGVHLVTVLRLADGGGAILVNRGWLPSPDATTADPRPYRSKLPVRVEGWLQAVPPPGVGTEPLPIDLGDTIVQSYRRMDTAALSAATAADLPPLYLELSPTDPAPQVPPMPVAAPTFDEGPHLGYAIQWFSFAAIAVGGFLVVLRVRLREGRGGGPEGV